MSLVVFGTALALDAYAQSPLLVTSRLYATGDLHVLGQELIFPCGTNTENGLCVSDGTDSGTTMIKGVPGNMAFVRYTVTVIDKRAYFIADDGEHGAEPWVSDGTAAGTFMLSDVNPGNGGQNPTQFTAFNGKVYFVADDGSHGHELWVTDGTSPGTKLAVDIVPGTEGSDPIYLTIFRSALFFVAVGPDGISGWWRSEGTPETTVRTGVLPPPSSLGLPFVALGDALYFVTTGIFGDLFLWRTDGTSAGTFQVSTESHSDYSLTVCGGKLYFGVFGPHPGLWESDGTAAGTVLLAASGPPTGINCVDRQLYFWGFTSSGRQVWKSGLAPGTASALTDVFQFALPAFVFQFVRHESNVYFVASAGGSGQELWTLDSSPVGAHLVADLNPGVADSSPADFVMLRGALFFTANNGSGRYLWRIGDLGPVPGSSVSVPGLSLLNLLFLVIVIVSTGYWMLLKRRRPQGVRAE